MSEVEIKNSNSYFSVAVIKTLTKKARYWRKYILTFGSKGIRVSHGGGDSWQQVADTEIKRETESSLLQMQAQRLKEGVRCGTKIEFLGGPFPHSGVLTLARLWLLNLAKWFHQWVQKLKYQSLWWNMSP